MEKGRERGGRERGREGGMEKGRERGGREGGERDLKRKSRYTRAKFRNDTKKKYLLRKHNVGM